MASKRAKYHHGDLKAALIRAADEMIAEGGLEGFSLRAAAQRAGVSPSAPAHHFGSAKGLLTEVALLAYERVSERLNALQPSEDVATELRGLFLLFVKFAVENPGHFRLMFRVDMVNRADPRYNAVAQGPGGRLERAILAYRGGGAQGEFEDAVDRMAGLATLQGLAQMALESKTTHLFGKMEAAVFVDEVLPRVLERMYPAKG